MESIRNQFFDNDIRPEKVIHLGTMCLGEDWPDISEDAFDDDRDEILNALGLASAGDDDDLPEELWELGQLLESRAKLGWLVLFATPVPRTFSENGYSFSWGHYATQWIYGESFEDCCVKAVKWHAEFVEGRRQKAEQDAKATDSAEVQP